MSLKWLKCQMNSKESIDQVEKRSEGVLINRIWNKAPRKPHCKANHISKSKRSIRNAKNKPYTLVFDKYPHYNKTYLLGGEKFSANIVYGNR